MNAKMIALALGGRKSGASWMARCPAHDDRSPSLSLSDKGGQVLWRCWAGCDQMAVLEALRGLGLAPSHGRTGNVSFPRLVSSVPAAEVRGTTTKQAADLWEASGPAEGSMVKDYLANRQLALPEPNPTIRFHPSAPYYGGGSVPAMVAAVTESVTGDFRAVSLTFLVSDEVGTVTKVAGDRPRKFVGPIKGGVVRLGEPDDCLALCEGIETGLAVQMRTGEATWAALSAVNLRDVQVPDHHKRKRVRVFGDNDNSGTGQQAARKCAERLALKGADVTLELPKEVGRDFNDLVRRAA